MIRHALDSSLSKLYVDVSTVQIGLLASLLFVLSLYGGIFRGCNYLLCALFNDCVTNAIG